MLPDTRYTNIVNALGYISQGYTQTDACRKAGTSVAELRRAVEANPELEKALADAEQLGFDALADSLLDPEFGAGPYTSNDPKFAKLISDNKKWFLSRRSPQKYGDRMIVENHITADKAIIDALHKGRQRALEARVVDRTVSELTSEVVEEAVIVDPLARYY